MIACAILGLLHPIFAIAFGLGLLAYSAAILLAMVPLATKPAHWKAKATLPLVFMAVHAGFAWGSVRELARQLRRRIIARLEPGM
jgi:hypothetical protein